MPGRFFIRGRHRSLSLIASAALVVGGAALAQQDVPPAAADPAAVDVSPERGAMVFATEHCVDCHGNAAEGGFGPMLVGNANLDDVMHVVRQILRGGGQMPGFHAALDDGEVAALANWLRMGINLFAGEVSPADVANIRADTA